jgi:hypothetical protein
MALVERPRVRHSSEINVFSGSEVRALVGAATTELDRTLLLTAAFTGLRMGELLALRWGEVDFTAETILELKEWMGHANVTTMRYLHYKSKAGAAQRLAAAFQTHASLAPRKPRPRLTSIQAPRQALSCSAAWGFSVLANHCMPKRNAAFYART